MRTDNIYTYDIETYPNVFTCVTKHFDTGMYWIHEWSERRNDVALFISFIHALKTRKAKMVGYNNEMFDYPVIHHLVNNPNITQRDLFRKVDSIINCDMNERFDQVIWGRDRHVDQVDLLRINHFDNVARFTSLKMLEFNMRSENIQDLPYKPGINLFPTMIDFLIKYNINDVDETEKFLKKCSKAIGLREELSAKFGKDFTNHNDTRIGKDYFIMELEKSNPGICFQKTVTGKIPNQTVHQSIALREVILPYVRFEHPEFNKIHHWFYNKVIVETKGSIKGLSCTIDGFQFDFGTGGIHGSIESTVVESDDAGVIVDVDVASYYPNLAIKNQLFPAHLSKKFCEIYEFIYNERKKHAKGTPENMVFKLALNGTYGDSGNKYSPFFDTKFMMAITINGQLSLCMLAEQMMKIPGLQMIQINTDGLTFKVPRESLEFTREICRWWEEVTKLELEEAIYSRMMIRDVNSYIAEYVDIDKKTGRQKLKRKGAYEYKREWHKNHSSLVIPKAAEAFLVHGIEPYEFLMKHDDIMDFMLRTKVPRSSRLVLGTGNQIKKVPNPDPFWMFNEKNKGKDLSMVQSKSHFTFEKDLQNITRYYIGNTGGALVKIMPPTKKRPGIIRRICVNEGWKVKVCNNIKGMTKFDINYSFYLEEIEKLIKFAR